MKNNIKDFSKYNTPKRWLITVTSLLFLLFISVLVSVSVGTVKIPFQQVMIVIWNGIAGIHQNSLYSKIILQLRLPSIIMAVIVGVALSSSGASLQGLFRNPLIDPYILGISAGAAFGAALSITMGIDSYQSFYYLPISAFIGAIIAVTMVYGLSYSHGEVSNSNLIFGGIAVGYIFSAIVSFLMFVSGPHLQELIYWLLGSFSDALWGEIDLILMPVIISVFILFYFSKELNLLTGGEDLAAATGVNLKLTKNMIIFITTLLTAIAVSMSGIIGFVGLVIPHIMRRIVGNDYRILIPTSAIGGAILLVISDTIARTIISPVIVPVGVVTSFIGAPFFIYLFRRSLKRMEVSI
jgi:iron complex transport system permease protein